MRLGKNKVIGLLICIALLLSVLSCSVYAYEPIDTEKSASLTLSFKPDGKNASNVEFNLYRAASVSPDRQFTLSDKFNKYPLALNNLNGNGWRELAQTMAAYAAADNIVCDLSAKTDGNGTVCFTNLETGLYLIIGSGFKDGNYTYTPTPFIVSLPSYDNNDVWQYNQTAEVKYETTYQSSGGGGGGGGSGTLTRRVLKAWKNDDKSLRPESVSVTLLKNGTPYTAVTLSEDNDWTHTWENLSSGSQWQLIETDVPENYTVTVSKEGITFLVVNTYGKTTQPSEPDTPGDTDEPDKPSGGGSSSPSSPDNPTETENTTEDEHIGNSNPPDSKDTPNTEENTKESGSPEDTPQPDKPQSTDTLPQTGLLWWPVPLLAIGGILLLLISRVKQGADNGKGKGKKGLLLGVIGAAVILSAFALTAKNMREQSAAEKSSAAALAKMEFDTPLKSEDVGETVIPNYVLNPDMDMPSKQIDGMEYIGKLEIPSLGIVLPVAREWSYKSLTKAPCCYFGSIYKNNMVIAGHNYKRHFGGLKSLRVGDAVTFTDVSGNVFYYRAAEREILAADKTQEMTKGEYPLTLFTCTLNGGSRVAVRCEARQINYE